jgi:hypothetical protein
LFLGVLVLGAGLAVVSVSTRLFDAESPAGRQTVVEWIQGRCIERPLDSGDAELDVLTAQQEIERLGRTPPTFTEVADEAGVAFQHTRDDNFLNLGGGAAAADFNNDGWTDLYVTNSAGANALYRNNGDETFTDVAVSAGAADESGRGHGVAWGDYDNDGLLDLYVANYGNSRLFRNNGDETFFDVTNAAGVADPGPDYRTTGAVWGDYDQDGWLDMLIVRHVDAVGPLFTIDQTATIVLLRQCRTEEFYADPKVPRGVVIGGAEGRANRAKRDFSEAVRSVALYRNRGDGTFQDVTSLLDDGKGYPSNIEGAGFKPAFLDYDSDGDLDIYVVNDYGDEIVPNVLWRNEGRSADGKWAFRDVSEGSGVSVPMFGMGLAAGDYDNDSDLDFYVTDIGSGRFFENRDGLFEDVTERTGTGRERIPENGEVNLSIGWGAAFADFDNDGWLDLYMTAGQIDSDPCSNLPHQPNALFINKGDGTFADVSHASGANDPGTGREVVEADFNNDGRIDVFVVNMGDMEGAPGVARLFLNTDNSGNHWLQVGPVAGVGDASAVGARVEVTADGITRVQYVGLGQGHMSQSVVPLHFGLGETKRVDLIEVRWPDGSVQSMRNVTADQLLVVRRAP